MLVTNCEHCQFIFSAHVLYSSTCRTWLIFSLEFLEQALNLLSHVDGSNMCYKIMWLFKSLLWYKYFLCMLYFKLFNTFKYIIILYTVFLQLLGFESTSN